MSPASLWPILPLSEAFWFQEGPGVRKWQFTKSGIKLLNVGNLEKDGTLNLAKTDRYLDEAEIAEKYSHFLIDEGDLVIASSGISFDDDGLLRTRGTFIDSSHLPLCLNTSTIRFKAVEGMSDLRFLRFWLNTYEFRSQITKLVTGSAQQNFGPSHLKALKITLPPLEKQKRIADILDRAEALRAKRRAALSQLDELTQSIFIEMFGDPVENPKKFEVTKLQDISEIVSGVTKGRKLAGKSTVFVPYLRVANVQDGYLDLTEIKDIEVLPSDIEKYALQKGDVLLTEGGDPDKLGRGAVWNGQISKCIHQNHIFRVRVNGEYLVPEYLSALIGSAYGKKYFLKSAKQTTGIASINSTQLKNFPVLIAPLDLQLKFTEVVCQIEKITESQHQSLLELNNLFDSITHEAFTGKLLSNQFFEPKMESEVKI